MNKILKSILLPVISAAYPVIFLYSYNSSIVNLDRLVRPLLIGLLFGAVIFGIYFAVYRKYIKASLAAFTFLIFFFTYAPLYNFMLKVNKVQVEHFTLIPLYITIALYTAHFIATRKANITRPLQNLLLILITGLIIFNVISAVPVEAKKIQLKEADKKAKAATVAVATKKYPDIYYFLFDEYAGFDAVKDYWHETYVDDFAQFLKDNHFFVTTKSRGNSARTVLEMARRLNMKMFPGETEHLVLANAVSHNKVMQVVKSFGYTTVVFNSNFPYFDADVEYNYDSKEISQPGLLSDDFSLMLLDNTMFLSLSNIYRASTNDPEVLRSRNMTMFFLQKSTELSDIKSPKFVYVHLLFPHIPFIFDKNGRLIDPKNKMNWNFYIGQHEYATKQAKILVQKLLANADPNNPPVIILQSDHGARNLKLDIPGSVQLNDYPEPYMYYILDALYLPGYDYSTLKDPLQPIETFPMILNHYLGTNLSVEYP
jgi:hypothetical protein